jgi:hypothetical protein
MKLFNTTQFVLAVLRKFPETRDDDYLLWLKVIEDVARYNNIVDITKTFTVCDFLKVAKYSVLPHYKTVSRCRRKLQETYPALKATTRTKEARDEKEELFKAFARNDVAL